MAKTTKQPTKLKFGASKKSKILVLAIILVACAGIGVYTLTQSHAATSETLYYRNYLRVSSLYSQKVTKVNDLAAPYPVPPPSTGTAPSPNYVSQVAPGGVLVYDAPRPTAPILVKSCFVMRAAQTGQTAKVEIVNWDKVRTVSLTDMYQEYCVASSTMTDGNGKTYNLRHISGSAVNVLHMSQYINPSTDPTDPKNWSYNTLISDLSPGTVYACKVGPAVYVKAVSKGGTLLSWWFDSNQATSKSITSNVTSFQSIDIAGNNFFAYVQNPSAGGYSPATLPISSINSCI